MSDFSFLVTYILPEFSPTDVESQKRHYLYSLEKDEIEKVDKEFPLPLELKQFYYKIGYGFFHKHNTNSAFNRLMDPQSCMDINLKLDIYEFDPELDSYLERYSGTKLLFFEVNEGIYLAIDKIDNNGSNAIYLFDKKISNSLEEFLKMFDNDPELINDIQL